MKYANLRRGNTFVYPLFSGGEYIRGVWAISSALARGHEAGGGVEAIFGTKP